MIKRIFKTKDVYDNARDNIAKISINGNDGGVNGVLTSRIAITMTANWEPIISDYFSSGILSTVQNVSALAGKNILTTGRFTKKFYKGGGGYLNLRPEFRIVDWDATGNVLDSVRWLIGKMSPQGSVTEKGSDIDFLKKFEGIKNKMKTRTEQDGGFYEKVTNVAKDLGKNIVTGSPKPVTIALSNYFNSNRMGIFAKEFVITNLTTTFSKEITPTGPLYVDVNLDLSSIQALNSGEISNSLNNKNTRITVDKNKKIDAEYSQRKNRRRI